MEGDKPQIKLGRRYGKLAKRSEGGNSQSTDTDGFANMAGPIVVTIDHFKGMTAYTRAVEFGSGSQ